MTNTSTRLRVLWLTPRFLLGAPDGARHATATLIRGLTSQGVDLAVVSLIATGDELVNEQDAVQAFNLARCVVVHREGSRWKRWPSFARPLTVQNYATPSVRRAVMSEVDRFLARSTDPGVVIIDGMHPFASLEPGWLERHDAARVRVIYRAHNYETALWDQQARLTRTPLTWLFFKHQARLVRAFERWAAQQADAIAPVSAEDGTRFGEQAPNTAQHITPIGIDFSLAADPMAVVDGPLRMLFVGRLDWVPNRQGLRWFLSNVWARIIQHRPEATLKIVGVGNGEWLSAFSALRGVSILGRVADLDPLYAECSLTIAPLFQGSGTRVKILESAKYARPVLTTALGAEGTGLIPAASYFQAETVEAWQTFLSTVTVSQCRAVGLAAYKSVRERFDSITVAQRFIAFLSSLPSRR